MACQAYPKNGRRRRKKDEIRAANIKYVQDNRELVEGGRHWSCLVRFAGLVLMAPDKIEHEFGDDKLVRNALRSCLDFITPHIPDLLKLAELQCASQSYTLNIFFMRLAWRSCVLKAA